MPRKNECVYSAWQSLLAGHGCTPNVVVRVNPGPASELPISDSVTVVKPANTRSTGS